MAKRRVDINEKVLGMVAEYYGKRVAELVDEILRAALGDWDKKHEGAAKVFKTAQSKFQKRSSQDDWHALANATQDALEKLLTDETLRFYADGLKEETSYMPELPESAAAKAKFVASAQERRASLRGQVGTIKRMQGRLRDAQRADGSDDADDADETKKVGQARQRHALVGALGVGMAMLAPLVGDALGLWCGTIDAPGTDATRDADADEAVRAAFTARVPLRLSEACLVVHSRMPTG